MITVKELINKTTYDKVAKEIKYYYGEEYVELIYPVYLKLKSVMQKKNTSNMRIFIRALKENAEGDEDIVINDFDVLDKNIMYDICGVDDLYDGLYSVASSEYSELLGYYVEEETIKKFSSSQIIAHLLFEIEWQ